MNIYGIYVPDNKIIVKSYNLTDIINKVNDICQNDFITFGNCAAPMECGMQKRSF